MVTSSSEEAKHDGIELHTSDTIIHNENIV